MRILIIGTGRMGAWLCEELCLDHEVAVYDSDPIKMKYFIKVSRFLELGEAKAFDPEMVVNCVSLGYTVDVFKSVLPFVGKDCILADIASVKTGLADFYRASDHPFVSSHPMFGPTFANIRELQSESAAIISEGDQRGKDFFRALYSKLGIRIFEFDFEGHDKMIAYSLATPFASTMVFASCMKKIDTPGTNFKRHMTIAKGLLSEDDRLLTEIMFNPYTIRQLEQINSKLSYLTHIIKGRDSEEMKKFLDSLRANIEE
jgi:prephenate dehydrogenase